MHDIDEKFLRGILDSDIGIGNCGLASGSGHGGEPILVCIADFGGDTRLEVFHVQTEGTVIFEGFPKHDRFLGRPFGNSIDRSGDQIDKDLVGRAEIIRDHGQRKVFDSQTFQVDLRVADVQAHVGRFGFGHQGGQDGCEALCYGIQAIAGQTNDQGGRPCGIDAIASAE